MSRTMDPEGLKEISLKVGGEYSNEFHFNRLIIIRGFLDPKPRVVYTLIHHCCPSPSLKAQSTSHSL